MVQEREVPGVDQLHNVDLAPQPADNQRSELHARFTAELDKSLMSPQHYRAMMRSLNSKQMDVVMYHRKWCKDTILALKHDHPLPQYTMFLSGPGGVGKSHVIKLIHYETMKLLKPLSGHFEPDELPVLLTAFTGTAAFGIDGMTLHSALSFTCGPRSKKVYQPASSEKLNTLRSRLGKLKLLIIDEVSMVGADLLYHIHRRLQDICGGSDPDSRFGGVSILAVGDLFQLQPVGQNHVFGLPSDSYARLHGSLWAENFHLIELTESMRQKEDQQFADLLMRVRTATCTQEDVELLKTRVVSKSDNGYPSDALHVFKTNKEVDEHNAEHLKQIQTPVFHIKSVDVKKDVRTGLIDVAISSKPSDSGGLREVVSVAVGVRVMVTVNINVSDGLANGVCGTVTGIDSTGNEVHTILVKFDSVRVGKQAIADSQYKQIFPGSVPIQRQSVKFFTGKGRQSVEAKRSQFPLTLAWGCTIHKVQGKTLDKIVVCMQGNGAFMPGQAYDAFSRVRNLNSLYFIGFDAKAIKVNAAAIAEMDRMQVQAPLLMQGTDMTHCSDTGLKITLLNIRSYVEHEKDLHVHKELHNVDIFCFVETFLKESHQVSSVLGNSRIFRADRPTSLGRGGGVMIAANEDVSPYQLVIPLSGIEYTIISVTKCSRKINIVTVYRPPNFSPATFFVKIQNLIRSLPSDDITVIVGDFNFDLIVIEFFYSLS